MKKRVLETIEALAENEVLVSRIYAAFSEKLPEHREFWAQMAEEEVQHADMIRALVEEVRKGTVHLKGERLDETSVGIFRDYLKYSLARARDGDLEMEDALETALAIEHDLIERSFFDLFEAEGDELKIILEGLAASARGHHRRLLAVIEEWT